jgi:lipid A 3-O-deacylase
MRSSDKSLGRFKMMQKFLGTSLKPVLALFSLLAISPVYADRNQTEHWTLNLYVENDLFSETDQDYTSGIRASWVSPDLQDYLDDPSLPGWIRKINRRLTFFHKTRKGLKRNVTFSIGQTIYTPEDWTRTDPIPDDRPYAGWLFASMGYQTRNDDQLDTLETRFGVVGPAAHGKEGQDFIHDLRGFEKFEGWHNQLRNEPGVVFLWEHKRKYKHLYNPNSRFGFDLIGHSGISLGNVRTYLNAGAELRLGWAIPDDFGTSALRPGGDNSTPDVIWDPRVTADRSWGAHVFVSFDTRVVGRDIFLDGNTFKESASVDKETVVGDAAVGFSFIYRGAKFSYAHIFRTREFSEQDDSHSYGSLAFSYTFR